MRFHGKDEFSASDRQFMQQFGLNEEIMRLFKALYKRELIYRAVIASLLFFCLFFAVRWFIR